MSLTVVRSRKRLTTTRKVTSGGALAMNGIDMAAEILLQCKSLEVGTASNIALEGALMALRVFTSDGVSVGT